MPTRFPDLCELPKGYFFRLTKKKRRAKPQTAMIIEFSEIPKPISGGGTKLDFDKLRMPTRGVQKYEIFWRDLWKA